VTGSYQAAGLVRDSKHPAGGTLIVTPPTWTAFTTALRANKFG
jgi:hypothetical protein